MKSRGFTLIELLVVIAIIGMLSSIVLASLNTARKKGRDARKITDLKSIQLALQLYYDDNGHYPPNHSGCCAAADYQSDFLQELVSGGYLSSKPIAPTSPSDPYLYYDYGSANAMGTMLVVTLEAITPTTQGSYGTCRPFSGSNWCRSDVASTYYCLCMPY